STVTWNMFPMLGIQPILGRQFREDEDRPGAPPVVMLSYAVWQRRYAGDPAIVGRALVVNGTPHTVVGVMPPRFHFPQQAQLWVPQTPIEHTSARANRNLQVYARMKPGVRVDSARRDIGEVAAKLSGEYEEDKNWGANALPLRQALVPSDVRLVVFTMMG